MNDHKKQKRKLFNADDYLIDPDDILLWQWTFY